MYFILIAAVGLLRVTSTAAIPKPDAETVERPAISRDVFAVNKFPQLLCSTGGNNLNKPFTFQNLLVGPDVPVLNFALADRKKELDIRLYKPARGLHDDAMTFYIGLVFADQPGMVHKEIAPVDRSRNFATDGFSTILPIEQFQNGTAIPDGQYHVVIWDKPEQKGVVINMGVKCNI